MSTTEVPPGRSKPEPLPDNVPSAQPGGGVCYSIELAWGRWRRWYLKHLRPAYVRRMAELRRGDCPSAPHEILDPRDLKYCRNRCHCEWDRADDPFAWRDRIPFARWGLAELQLMGGPLLCLTVFFAWYWWYVAPVFGALLALVLWFFRDPPRRIPQEPGILVSPADGKVVEVTRLERDGYIGGPAVRIGIFLSILNVHLNRAPEAARVIALRYHPGDFISALDPECAVRNENMWIGLEEETPPYRRMALRQIAGAVARRIVCPLRPGDVLARGEKIGMIKLGSRTELILPDGPELRVEANVGDRVRAGVSVVARRKEIQNSKSEIRDKSQ
jgi:phosphatidylserine decarboxylase